jgi:hypothetical protein
VNPSVMAFANPSSICKGESTPLSATGSTGTYNWNNGAGAGTPRIVTPTATTTYTVTGTTTNGCPNKASVTVTVNPVPNVRMTVNPTSIKPGASAVLTGSGAASYTWSHGLGTGATKNVSPASTTTYTVTGETSGCTKNATGKVTVK